MLLRLIILVLMLCTSMQGAYANTKKPVVFFHDGAYDDIFALLILSSAPEVDLKMVVIETVGETTCTQGLFSTLGVLKNINRLDIPVFCGPSKSLTKLEHDIDVEFPQKWKDEINDLNALIWGYELPEHEGHWGFRTQSEMHESNKNILSDINNDAVLKRKYDETLKLYNQHEALSAIYKILNEQNNRVYILETGPVVTMAHLVRKDLNILNKVESITVMGGSFNIPKQKPPGLWGKIGNIQTVFTDPKNLNENAEWNIYMAPRDFDVLLKALQKFATKLNIVPLNVTKDAQITLDYEKNFINRNNRSSSQTAKWINAIFARVLQRYRFQISKGYLEFWDTLAAILFVEGLNDDAKSSSISSFEESKVKVLADKSDYPVEFYNKYEEQNLSNFYSVSYLDFVQNINSHHAFAKNKTGLYNSVDNYGTTVLASTNDNNSTNAILFLSTDKEKFDEVLWDTLPS